MLRYSMLLKIIFSIFILSFLNGCVPGTALLGPVLTGASTGSVYQASLSYGSGKIINNFTGKTTTENIKTFLEKNKVDDSEKADNFFEMVKKINKNSGVENLANQ